MVRRFKMTKFKAFMLFTALVVGSLIYSNKKIDNTPYVIKSVKLPESFDGFKIAQVSDFHSTYSWFQADIESLISKLKNEKPDIIVLTGDSVDTNDDFKIGVTKTFVKTISEIAPVYIITGNHEITLGKTLPDFLSELDDFDNVMIMRNTNTMINKGDGHVNLIGIDDPVFLPDRDAIPDLISSLIIDSSEYNILLSHRPEEFDAYVKSGVDLVFTGHAHGGQVRIPFVGGVYTFEQGLWPKYTSGVFVENDTSMVISRGVGNSTPLISKLRINNSPELVVVTLEKE